MKLNILYIKLYLSILNNMINANKMFNFIYQMNIIKISS